jgi:porin
VAAFWDFADQRWGSDGRSLADATSTGALAMLAGNYGFWIVAEQELCHFDGDEDRTAGVFLRASTSPADRNPIDFYADAGVEVVGANRQGPHDRMGISVGYAHVPKALQALDLDYRKNGISCWPIRDSETMMTAAYQYEIQSGWTVQPSFQYIVHPSGGASQSMPGRKLTNASVLGFRTVLKF